MARSPTVVAPGAMTRHNNELPLGDLTTRAKRPSRGRNKWVDAKRRFTQFSWIAILLCALVVPRHALARRGSHGGHSGGTHSSSLHSGSFSLGSSSHIGTSHSAGTSHSSSPSTSGKGVHVRSYHRKDGTVVHAYARRSPGTATVSSPPSASKAAAPKTTHARKSPTTAKAVAAKGASPSEMERDSHGRIARSKAAKDAFMRAHPCPSTGKTNGACPGYVVDHVQALKHGGADAPFNMQWQTTEDAKAKDKLE